VISGAVKLYQGPVVSVVLCDASGGEHLLAATVDTGFTGWITLPKSVIVSLGLAYKEETKAVLADGTLRTLPSYRVTVIWDGLPMQAFVDELESEPLIGMRLLHGFRFTMDAIEAGAVQIERL
jgi:clan AA aspartic protease